MSATTKKGYDYETVGLIELKPLKAGERRSSPFALSSLQLIAWMRDQDDEEKGRIKMKGETRVLQHREQKGDIYHHSTENVSSTLKRLEEVQLQENQKAKVVRYLGSVTEAAFPTDALLALNKAIRQASSFGMLATEKVVEFLGMKMTQTQQTMQIETHDGSIEARVGPVHISGVGQMEIWANQRYAGLVGEIEQDKVPVVEQIMVVANKLAAAESIYRGHAIKIRLAKDDDEYNRNPAEFFPKFIKPVAYGKEDLILNQMDALNLETSLWAPIEKTAAVRARLDGTVKRGILMAGAPGTGKTMVMALAASIAPKHGWTYIEFQDAKDLPKALQLAAKLTPAVVASEDIDRADNAGQRNDAMNAILNSMDGAQNKKAEIITLLTTNHIEMLTEPLLRPGRFDEIIELGQTDVATATKLLQRYSGMTTVPGEIVKDIVGWTPAVIAEVGKKAKLYAEVAEVKEPGLIHFQLAVRSMQTRHEILARKRPQQDPLQAAIAHVVNHLRGGMKEESKKGAERVIAAVKEMGGL